MLCIAPLLGSYGLGQQQKLLDLHNWLVVSTHLKNISQNGNLPRVGMKIKDNWNGQLDKMMQKEKVPKIFSQMVGIDGGEYHGTK